MENEWRQPREQVCRLKWGTETEKHRKLIHEAQAQLKDEAQWPSGVTVPHRGIPDEGQRTGQSK